MSLQRRLEADAGQDLFTGAMVSCYDTFNTQVLGSVDPNAFVPELWKVRLVKSCGGFKNSQISQRSRTGRPLNCGRNRPGHSLPDCFPPPGEISGKRWKNNAFDGFEPPGVAKNGIGKFPAVKTAVYLAERQPESSLYFR